MYRHVLINVEWIRTENRSTRDSRAAECLLGAKIEAYDERGKEIGRCARRLAAIERIYNVRIFTHTGERIYFPIYHFKLPLVCCSVTAWTSSLRYNGCARYGPQEEARARARRRYLGYGTRVHNAQTRAMYDVYTYDDTPRLCLWSLWPWRVKGRGVCSRIQTTTLLRIPPPLSSVHHPVNLESDSLPDSRVLRSLWSRSEPSISAPDKSSLFPSLNLTVYSRKLVSLTCVRNVREFFFFFFFFMR